MAKKTISTKIVILGAPAVGKTTLRINLIGHGLAKDYMMTLGAEIGETTIDAGNVIFEAQIWDIAGQENFLPITRGMLQGTQGAVIVFDLTRDYTFSEVSKWLEILHEENSDMDQNIPYIVVGNKEDLTGFINTEDSVVNSFLDYANRHNVYSKTEAEYIKTSAKTGHQVKEAFTRLAQLMVDNFMMEEPKGNIPEDTPPTEKSPIYTEEKIEEFLSVSEMLRLRREKEKNKKEGEETKIVDDILKQNMEIDKEEIYTFSSISKPRGPMASKTEDKPVEVKTVEPFSIISSINLDIETNYFSDKSSFTEIVQPIHKFQARPETSTLFVNSDITDTQMKDLPREREFENGLEEKGSEDTTPTSEVISTIKDSDESNTTYYEKSIVIDNVIPSYTNKKKNDINVTEENNADLSLTSSYPINVKDKTEINFKDDKTEI